MIRKISGEGKAACKKSLFFKRKNTHTEIAVANFWIGNKNGAINAIKYTCFKIFLFSKANEATAAINPHAHTMSDELVIYTTSAINKEPIACKYISLYVFMCLQILFMLVFLSFNNSILFFNLKNSN